MVLSNLIEKARSRFFDYRKKWLVVLMKANAAFPVLPAIVCFACCAAYLLECYWHVIKTI